MTIRLGSGCLARKSGFCDGDVLDDVLYDAGFDSLERAGEDHLNLGHEVLARCVERYLLPDLPTPVRTYRIGTIHNPVRAEESDFILLPTPEVIVEISDDQVLEIARAVSTEMGASAPNERQSRRTMADK